jgi:hypothetical protein
LRDIEILGDVDSYSKFFMKNIFKIFFAIVFFLFANPALAQDAQEQVVVVSTGDDFYSMGSLVELNTDVQQNAYLGGVKINVDKNIGKDLTVFGDEINIFHDSIIDGSATLIGDSLNFQGEVKNNLQFSGGKINFAGKVGGDVQIRTNDKITFSDNARINGSLIYFSDKEIDLPANVANSIERKDFTDASFNNPSWMKSNLWGKLFFFLMSFVAGAVLLSICGRSSEVFANTVREKFWQSLLIGVLILFAPLLVILLLSSMVGFWLGFILLAVWVLFLLASGVLMGFLVGSFLLKQQKKTKYPKKLLTLLLGLLILAVIGMIPDFGNIFKFMIFTLTLGALFISKIQLYKQAKKAKII